MLCKHSENLLGVIPIVRLIFAKSPIHMRGVASGCATARIELAAVAIRRADATLSQQRNQFARHGALLEGFGKRAVPAAVVVEVDVQAAAASHAVVGDLSRPVEVAHRNAGDASRVRLALYTLLSSSLAAWPASQLFQGHLADQPTDGGLKLWRRS